jgi:O-antigen/teichoic acid export membrane protein
MFKRVFKGAFASALSFAVTIAATVLQVPVMLAHWGQETMGAWFMLLAVQTLLTTFDTSHHAYVGNLINMEAETDREKMRATLGSSLRLGVLVGLLPLVVVAIGTCCFDLGKLLGVAESAMSSRDIALFLLLVSLQWSYTVSLSGLVTKLYTAFGDFARLMNWITAYRCVHTVCLLTAVSLGLGVLPTICIILATTVVFHLVQFYDVYRRYPTAFPWWERGSLREGWRNYRNSWLLAYNQIGFNLLTSGPLLLVGRTLGSVEVASYSATRTMANVAQTANSIVIYPLVPEFGRMFAAGKGAEIGDLVLKVSRIAACCSVLALPLVALFGDQIFGLWTQGKISIPEGFFYLLFLSVLVRVAGAAPTALLTSTNQSRYLLVCTWANVGLLFALGYALIGGFGLLGITTAALIGEVVGAALLPLYFAARVIRSRQGLSVWITRCQPVGLVLFSVLPFFISIRLASWEWLGWLLYSFICIWVILRWDWTWLGNFVGRRFLRAEQKTFKTNDI